MQKEISQKKIKELADIQRSIAEKYKEYDRLSIEQEKHDKMQEIENKKQELKNEAESYEMYKKQRIENLYVDSNGKNTAVSHMPVKELKSSNKIQKLEIGEEEVTDPERIIQILCEKHKDLVGGKF